MGVHWTLVSSRLSGLASTLTNIGPHGSWRVRDVGDFLNKSVQELAGWLQSENQLEASIGMAALNSLIEPDVDQLQDINAADVLAGAAGGRNLVVVGHFPFIERLRGSTRNLWVIEKHPYGDEIPESAAESYIPLADMVAITGTTIINHTIDGLMALCRPGVPVMMLGPSTPLSPVLFDHGITFVSGSRVIDESAARLTIQQGAGFPQVNGVQVVTMVKPG